jgi:hypothetical protein
VRRTPTPRPYLHDGGNRTVMATFSPNFPAPCPNDQ